MTLLEVMIAMVLASVVLFIASQFMTSAQQQATTSAVRQRTNGESRRMVHLLAREVRGLNLTATDLNPTSPFQSTSLEYRVVTGYDTGTQKVVLSPSRASGLFRRLRLQGTEILREVPGSTVTLASGISDLRFTLASTNRLTIEVAVTALDSKGATVERRATLVITLANSTDAAQ
jgi:hypothetical protein